MSFSFSDIYVNFGHFGWSRRVAPKRPRTKRQSAAQPLQAPPPPTPTPKAPTPRARPTPPSSVCPSCSTSCDASGSSRDSSRKSGRTIKPMKPSLAPRAAALRTVRAFHHHRPSLPCQWSAGFPRLQIHRGSVHLHEARPFTVPPAASREGSGPEHGC